MITTWTKHLKTDEAKSGFEKQFRNSVDVLDRLSTIIQESLDDIERSEVSISDYDSPSWSSKQAFRNGQRSTLRSILRLINPDQGAHNDR